MTDNDNCHINNLKTESNNTSHDIKTMNSALESQIIRNNSKKIEVNHDVIRSNRTSTCMVDFGSMLVCEERCIDHDESNQQSGIADFDKNGRSKPSPNSIRINHKRILTLAPPILNLRWEDVGPSEVLRQMAIEAFLTKLSAMTDDLLAGIRIYRNELQNEIKLHPNDLRGLFYNIVEVSYFIFLFIYKFIYFKYMIIIIYYVKI